ncbi:hypothetical protein [Fibrobacter sp. UWP2]|uniref:hypothetical protein n=1 Tax=Fibrobacter sp. UWP2 TaxID=1896216 RepID=UPI001160788F|nr:hypothetical protein [Fibrobacter sp. UWP2]
MKKILLIFVFFQMSFAMDPSIEAALKCVEKKKMDVHAVEKINGKVYARGWFVPADDDACDYKTVSGSSVFEIKNNCVIEKKDWFKEVEKVEKKGLLGAFRNSSEDSVIVIEKNKILWSCPFEKVGSRVFRFLDKNRLMVSIEDGGNGDGDSIGVLDNKCQWTLFEKKARLPYIYSATSSSRFLDYELKHKPYIVIYDSLYNKYWGTSSSFYTYVSTRNIACGYDDDKMDSSKALIKCIKWTGNNFVEETLPHKVDVPDSEGCLCACPWTERLFPCGDGICVQNYETKKIEILVDE